MKNDLVSFLIHPVGIKQIKENFGSVYNNLKFLQPVVNRISDRFVKSAYTLFPPHRFLKVNNIISESKSKIDLEIIMLPLFPSQLVGLNKDFIEEKICDSIEYASKIGSKLIALGGFTSIAGNQVKGLLTNKKKCNIAVTTGNTLTAALCIEGIIKACELLEKKN